MDEKNNLNLPRTDFPMKADLVAREPQRLAKWSASKLYERIQERLLRKYYPGSRDAWQMVKKLP